MGDWSGIMGEGSIWRLLLMMYSTVEHCEAAVEPGCR